MPRNHMQVTASLLRGKVTLTRELAGTEIMIDPPLQPQLPRRPSLGTVRPHHDCYSTSRRKVQSHEEAPCKKNAITEVLWILQVSIQTYSWYAKRRGGGGGVK